MGALLYYPVLILIAFGIWAALSYNRFVRLRNQLREAWSSIEVQLSLRHSLVPALVQCVQGYKAHEVTSLVRLTEQRAAAMTATGPTVASQVETSLAHELGNVIVQVEDYPELRSADSFQNLMGQLTQIEDTLQYARRYYNGTARDLNNLTESFPSVIIASAVGQQVVPYFEVPSAIERAAPKVSLPAPL